MKIKPFNCSTGRRLLAWPLGLAVATLACATIQAQPANDDCATPTVVTVCSFSDTLDTTTATTAGSDPLHSCSNQAYPQTDNNTVWYGFTPTSSGTISIDTAGTTYMPIVVAVYTGSCGALTEVVCEFLFDSAPSFTFTAQAGTAYLIEVADWYGDGGGGGTLHFALNFLNWKFREAPNADHELDKIRIDPDDDNLWYVGSTHNGLYITRDGGSTWEQHLSGLTWGLAIDPTHPNRIYAGSAAPFSYNNLYRSDDKGHTWSLIRTFPSDETIYSILVSSVNGSVFAGMHWGASKSPNGVYKSTDQGQSWTFCPFNIPPLPYNQDTGLIIWDIAEDPVNTILYVATEVAGKPPCMPTCYDPPTLRSMDGGQTWQDVSGNLSSPGSLSWHATRIQVHPVTHDVYFQVEGGQVFTSGDCGDSWEGLGAIDSCWDLIIDHNDPTRFFGGGLDGQVRLSRDTGRSFVAVGPPGVAGNGLFHVALNSKSTKLFACYSGSEHPGGIYVADLMVGNSPPLARCHDVILTAGADGTATGSVDDGSYDPDSDPITLTQDPPGPYPLGRTPVTLTATDIYGASDTCIATVMVIDVTPPQVACSVDTSTLWPPKHVLTYALTGVGFKASAVDNCDGTISPSSIEVQVFSDEDELAPASGNFSPDAKNRMATGTLRLRAERRGDADGRVYLIVAKATDSAGNTGFCTSTVSVTRDQSAPSVASVAAQAAAAQAYAAAHKGAPPPGYFVIGNGPIVGSKQ